MNTQQLECFLHVADKLNFTKAAEELYISTPAVTHHIKNLEEELNTTLFIRTPKMVKLTETGKLFYSEAKSILEKIALAEKKIKKLASQKLAVLRIGCSSQSELDFLENALTRIREEFPAVYPQIIVQDYFALKSLFDNNHLDVLIGTREMVAEAHNYIFKKAVNISSFAIVSPKSPLAEKNQISYKDLFNITLITMHPRCIPFQYGNKLQEFITLHGQKHLQILCENDQSAILFAKCNYGVAILPEIYIPSYIEDIVILPFAEKQTAIEYGIAYHKNLQDIYIKQFIKYFSEGSFPFLIPKKQ
ncbi:LysR family transcriptional regulator [Lachnoclostridium edouardi]|uniref:LysR family transcriptional regulator n=1 Tax=Lachnoclostridium edouardi TaxID=1926283 RepID=UPI000C79D10E|nr:LysR family transcriptional regulator [Lachnoclostridium edouardi]